MSIREKLLLKKQKMLEQIHKGRERTEQQKAEKLRRKKNKFKNMKPGARRAMTEGLMLRSNPMTVMEKEYDRRKHERKQKYEQKEKKDS